jgi:hypothetical protein
MASQRGPNKRATKPPAEFIQDPVSKAKTPTASRSSVSTPNSRVNRPSATPSVSKSATPLPIPPGNIDPNLPPPVTPTHLQSLNRSRSIALPSTESTPGASNSSRSSSQCSGTPSKPPKSRTKKQKIATPTGDSDASSEPESDGDEELGDVNGPGSDSYPWDAYLVRVLCEAAQRQVELGLQNGTGFKGDGWKNTVKDVNEASGIERQVDKKKVHSKWQTIKKQWKVWVFHDGHLSGWSPNTDPTFGDIGIPVSSFAAMEAHYKKHKKCRKFREQYPENYGLLQGILGNRMADGREAVGLRALIGTRRARESDEDEDNSSSNQKRRRKGVSKMPGLREQAISNARGQLGELREILSLRNTTILSRAMERANQELGHDRVAKREIWDVFSESQQKAEMFMAMDREDIEYYVERWTGRKVVWGPKDDIRHGDKAINEFEEPTSGNSNGREVVDE